MVKNVFGLYCVKLSMGNTKHLALKFAKDLNKKIITTCFSTTLAKMLPPSPAFNTYSLYYIISSFFTTFVCFIS